MTLLFYIVICFLILIFVKESYEKIHVIVSVIMVFIILQIIFATKIIPFFKTLSTTFQSVPFIGLLLGSTIIIIFGEFCMKLFEQYDYEVLQYFVHLIVGMTIALLWMEELFPYLDMLDDFLQSVIGLL